MRRETLKTLLNAIGPRVVKFGLRMRKLIHHVAMQTPHGDPVPALHKTDKSNGRDADGIEMVVLASSAVKDNDQLNAEIRAIYAEVDKLHRLYDFCSKILEDNQSSKLLVVYHELKTRLEAVCKVELQAINESVLIRLERMVDVTDTGGTCGGGGASVASTNNSDTNTQVSPGASTHSVHADKSMSSYTSATTTTTTAAGSGSNLSTPRHSTTSQDDVLYDDSDQFMLFKPKLIWKLEKTRQDPGELWNPAGIAFRPNGGVVVAEYDIMNVKNNRLRLFDAYGKTQGVLAQGLIKPLGVACNRDGNIAVTDCEEKRVKIFRADGTQIQEIGKAVFGWPYGVTCNSKGQYIVSDPFHDNICIFSYEGRKIKTFGSSGSQTSQFKNPFHISCDSRDNIIVSDSGNNSVKVYDPQGHFMHMSGDLQRGRISELARHKQKSSKLKGPRGVAVDMKDNIIVADDCGRVCLLDQVGKYVRNLLTEEDTVKYPEALATNSAGYLALTEWNPNNMFALKIFNMYE